MKKHYFKFLIPIVCCPFFTSANETLPIDTKRQVFIYETIRDYKPKLRPKSRMSTAELDK